ncbi:MAG: alpha/beta fold hydrolase [Deltaproteobacteria bacterium]|jgi:pimeloyl-ACP methyl ester carboxylesterase|nr:alpha/beta fold hydrolase [Deltaproteobacteria bacterium]
MQESRFNLAYDDLGGGLPVVLIHGFPLCRKMWRPQHTALSQAGFRSICPDLPGFGETPAAAGQASMACYADAVVALLDQLNLERAIFGGMSMGGYVLLELLERHIDRALAAMFCLTRAAADDPAGKAKRTSLADAVSNGDFKVVPDTFSQVLFAPQTADEQPELVSEVQTWMQSTSVDGLVGGLLAMRDRRDFVDRLAGFDLPALVIGAELDLAVPAEHARLLAARLPQSTLAILPNAGHMANLEQPHAFNQAMLSFLAAFANR